VALASLSDKVAVVTGGAAGMGRGIAERLIAAGMHVVIADIEPQALGDTARELGIEGVRTDVRRIEDVQALADRVIDQYGAVHVVCNNAGIGPVGAIEDMTLDDWRWVLDVNLWGVINGVHAFLPLLKRNAQGGHIVNTSSMSGLMPGPMFGAYTVSKYGVVALTEVLALELQAENSAVMVSVLLPGPTETRIATSTRNRDASTASGLADLDLRDTEIFPGGIPWKTPQQIGDIVVAGLRSGELYLFTHPQLSSPIFDRFDRIRAASDQAQAAAGE
jgi:NAD(P)-dependent dehydrogenase (short-subunit alcohol dehydrogenase family)